MKSPKSYLDGLRHEQRDERTDRISKTLTEEASAERRDKSRLLREARLERLARKADEEPSGKWDRQDDEDEVS